MKTTGLVIALLALAPLAGFGVRSLLQAEAIEEWHFNARWYRMEIARKSGERRAHGKIETWWADGHRQLQANCIDSPIPRFEDIDAIHRQGTLVIVGGFFDPLLFASHEVFMRGEVTLDGPFAMWYSGGQQWISGKYQNGKRIGTWKLWDIGGWLREEGTYQNGVPHGTWTRWTQAGEILGTTEFINGSGKYREWDDQDRLKGEVEIANGRRHGFTRYWYPDGTKWSEDEYANGELHGLATAYDHSGRLRLRQEYDKGRPSGTWTAWDEDGGGESYVTYKDGHPWSGSFSEGRLHQVLYREHEASR